MKKVLMLASVASMMSQFNMSNIEILQKLGCEVHVACNFVMGNTCNEKELKELKKELKEKNVLCIQIDFSRNIFDLKKNVKAYRQVKSLLKKHQYAFIHCHSPVGGVVGRIAACGSETATIYTAHGFHFFKGASIKNWLLFFPVEWICSWLTDVLITINKEDFCLAERRLHARRIEYVPGVGVDLKKFNCEKKNNTIRDRKRKELNLQKQEKMLLSVGELNKNKNHVTVIKALSKFSGERYHYYICGQGELQAYLTNVTRRFNLEDKVTLLGYRDDVYELYQAADIFMFPSKREGLSVALMEAMASGLPVICSKIRGNTDLITDGKEGFLVKKATDSKKIKDKLEKLFIDDYLRKDMKIEAELRMKGFSKEVVEEKMAKIYEREYKV